MGAGFVPGKNEAASVVSHENKVVLVHTTDTKKKKKKKWQQDLLIPKAQETNNNNNNKQTKTKQTKTKQTTTNQRHSVRYKLVLEYVGKHRNTPSIHSFCHYAGTELCHTAISMGLCESFESRILSAYRYVYSSTRVLLYTSTTRVLVDSSIPAPSHAGMQASIGHWHIGMDFGIPRIVVSCMHASCTIDY